MARVGGLLRRSARAEMTLAVRPALRASIGSHGPRRTRLDLRYRAIDLISMVALPCNTRLRKRLSGSAVPTGTQSGTFGLAREFCED